MDSDIGYMQYAYC